MKIKLFEQYSELDFSQFNQISKEEYYNITDNESWLELNNYELDKIKSLIDIRVMSSYNDYWYRTPNLIELIKLEDDYYLVDFCLYGEEEKHYFKCDQLFELLKLLKLIKNIK